MSQVRSAEREVVRESVIHDGVDDDDVRDCTVGRANSGLVGGPGLPDEACMEKKLAGKVREGDRDDAGACRCRSREDADARRCRWSCRSSRRSACRR